jgi:protein-tyrosine-phosphatase
LKCFFIDNALNDAETYEDPETQEEERAKFEEVRREIKAWLK